MYSRRSFKIIILTFLCSTVTTQNIDFNQVVFVILSQPDQRHIKIANETKEVLTENLLSVGVEVPKVFDLHTDFVIVGGWSIYPLLPFLVKLIDETKWFIFLAENSRVHLQNLANILSEYPSDYGIFLVLISITIDCQKSWIVLQMKQIILNKKNSLAFFAHWTFGY